MNLPHRAASKHLGRAGWWTRNDEGKLSYLFTAGGLREALNGHDFEGALKVLASVGALPPPTAKGEYAKTVRIPGVKPSRLYEINLVGQGLSNILLFTGRPRHPYLPLFRFCHGSLEPFSIVARRAASSSREPGSSTDQAIANIMPTAPDATPNR